MKLPDYFTSSTRPTDRKEDERIAKLAQRAQRGDYNEGTIFYQKSEWCTNSLQDLITEQLTRTSSFLTPDGLSTLRSSFVVIVGLGGVGSHCTASLARSGVSHIRVIDFDQVTLSSLNRHSVATLADVGTPKVLCVRKRLEAVVPWVEWECFNEVWRESEAERLLGHWKNGRGRKPDYVVDAIDNIDSKVALLKYCHSHGIRVISSMGAGCKGDPTRVFVGDISASLEDPLSKSTRRRLRALGISEGIPVVYSIEKPGPGKATLLPLPDEEYAKGSVGELGVLPDFRVRILPVLGTMPAVFGLMIANHVIMEITGYPHEIGGGKGREKLYDTILGGLQVVEQNLAKFDEQDVIGLKIPINKNDVGYLVDEVFRGKSVLSGIPTRLALVRWRAPESGYKMDMRWDGQKTSKLRLRDLVCMTKEEAVVHEKEVLKGRKRPEDMYPSEVIRLVERRLREEQEYDGYR